MARARDLLDRAGYHTRETILACFGGAGFTDNLTAPTTDQRIRLIGLTDIYALDS